MRFGLLITLLIVIVLSAASGVAIWLGRHTPMPEPVEMLHLDQCAPPCWIGIVPGRTTRTQAIEAITSLYKTLPDYSLHSIQADYFQITNVDNPAKKYRVSFGTDKQEIVNSIDFELFDQVTIAELSVALGDPRYFILQHIGDGGDALLYGERDYGVMIFLMPYRRSSRNTVTWDIRPRAISFLGRGGHFRSNSRYVFLPWQSWRRYQYGSAQR